MKAIAAVVTSLLALGAVARPRPMDDGEPLREKTSFTAIVVDADGFASVQCWEISSVVGEDSVQVPRADGSFGTASVTPLAAGGDLKGIETITWSSSSLIWPIPGGAPNTVIDLSDSPSLFSVQSGLVAITPLDTRLSNAVSPFDGLVFQEENGDDWFYFEDNYSGSSAAKSGDGPPFPINIAGISATYTELIRVIYDSPPEHRVLSSTEPCNFTGIRAGNKLHASGLGKARVHPPPTVQNNIGGDL